MRLNEARRVAEALGNNVGTAYLHAALIAGTEIADDRVDSQLHGAVEEFLLALRRLTDASMDG